MVGQTQTVGVGFRSERGPVLISVMLSTGLVALDSTIIATAVPSIVRDLGGFAHFPWLFSVYLLTQAVTVPLYGKLADVVGRKPVMFFGIAVFLAGSVLCGAAWNMLSLILFRAVQGIGAGAVQPISMTIVGDLYSVKERAKVQGYVAGVWGAASVLGPTLGGVFAQYLSWRWIFFVNLPLGLAAAWMLARHLHEQITRRAHRIDYTGAALLIGGCSLVILATLQGGTSWAWLSAPSVLIFAAGAAMLIAFIAVERKAAEPVLPLWVFRQRTLVGGNLASFIVGALLIGLSSYVPNFAQGVLGVGAVVAGFVLAALTVGWPLAASLSGRIYLRIGFRDTSLIGGVVIVIGTVMCLLLSQDTNVASVSAACFVIGVGLGLVASPTLVAVQSVVGWDRRGVVTGTNMFFRSMGSALGAAVFGAIANSTLEDRLSHPPAALSGRLPSGSDATSLVLGSGGQPSEVAEYLKSSLYEATHHVFVGLVIVAVVGAATVLLMPRRPAGQLTD
ncbi:MDR family MFS transporter [Rugosimonospora africana]|uniref:MFS transporter n=1 Tax=Rugosimonospora africana TaxID=556532 RepID=A0A8J3QTN9_9ACTN|nr:MDR family MFS transporter [Rugosimonospora africana]GIH17265.1 MFS transporter [Rugosimonospora africana]